MKERPSWTEYIQPTLMGAASLLSMMGSMVAISVGADKTPEGKTNPFFYTALSTSTIYFGANVYKVGQVYSARCITFEEEEQRRGEFQELIIR